jgi:hypothetical protein
VATFTSSASKNRKQTTEPLRFTTKARFAADKLVRALCEKILLSDHRAFGWRNAFRIIIPNCVNSRTHPIPLQNRFQANRELI